MQQSNCFYIHRITEQLSLEETSGGCLVQPPYSSSKLKQAVQDHVQSSF